MQKGHNGTINNPNIRVLEAPPSPSPPPIITTNNGGSGGVPACASCRHQRKKCTEKCILAPFFPVERTSDFQAVHKIFGVSNVTKLVKGLSHEDANNVVNSLIWEANCRKEDPILGPLGMYQRLEKELVQYQKQKQQANIEYQLRQVAVQGFYNNRPYNNGDQNNGMIINPGNGYSFVGNGVDIDNPRLVNYSLPNMDKSLKPERDQQQQHQHGSILHSSQQMMNDFNWSGI